MKLTDLIGTGTSLLLSNIIDVNILLTTIISIFITLFGLTLGFLLLRLQSNLCFKSSFFIDINELLKHKLDCKNF